MGTLRKKKIAILGATGHIAKGLIVGFCRESRYELSLFARSPGRTIDFLTGTGCAQGAVVAPLTEFGGCVYDVIINCVGIGDPGKLKEAISSIFDVTETYDNLVLDYLKAHADSLYIHFSSGAAYGIDFPRPASESSFAIFAINRLMPGDYYAIAKLNAEAKHRAQPDLNIVDLRVFGYFSRFTDLGTKFFLSDVISCVQTGRELVTEPGNIVRDYIHPLDLLALVECCINKERINAAYDAYSLQPVTKFDVLDYFSTEHNLKYSVSERLGGVTVTGSKENYYSVCRRAEGIGYTPQFTSLESIAGESQVILGNGR